MRAHENIMADSGLAPMWASLLALAQRPPRPHTPEPAIQQQEAAGLRQQLHTLTQRTRRYKERIKHLEVGPGQTAAFAL
jgi:hypothetical protein